MWPCRPRSAFEITRLVREAKVETADCYQPNFLLYRCLIDTHSHFMESGNEHLQFVAKLLCPIASLAINHSLEQFLPTNSELYPLGLMVLFILWAHPRVQVIPHLSLCHAFIMFSNSTQQQSILHYVVHVDNISMLGQPNGGVLQSLWVLLIRGSCSSGFVTSRRITLG
jgi:hypothetical protein